MTQPAQQPPAEPPQQAQPPPQGQTGQQPPPGAPPATPAPNPQQPAQQPQPAQGQDPQGQPQHPQGQPPYGYLPQQPPQQPPAAPPAPAAVPPLPPVPQPYTQPPQPTTTPTPPSQGQGQQGDPSGQPGQPDPDPGAGINWDRLPKAAREQMEQLRQQAAEAQTQARTAAVTTQAYTAAAQLGVNPQALVGSIAWQQAAAQLDPTTADYQQQLAATIQAIAQANPWMAVQQQPAGQGQPQAPARSGGDFAGAPGTPPPSLDEQIAEAQKEGNWKRVISLQNQKLTAQHQNQQQQQ